MKKSFKIIVLMLLVTTAAHAQLPIKFGLKGGLNITKVKFDKDVVGTDNQTGFFIGPMAEFTIPIVGLGADVAVLYDQKKIEVDNEKETLKYIDIPINVKYTLGLGDMAGIYIATGPQFSFNVGDDKILKADTYKMKSSTFSWNVGAGVKLINHIQVGYNYNIGIGKTAELNGVGDYLKGAGKMKNNSHQISVAYLF